MAGKFNLSDEPETLRALRATIEWCKTKAGEILTELKDETNKAAEAVFANAIRYLELRASGRDDTAFPQEVADILKELDGATLRYKELTGNRRVDFSGCWDKIEAVSNARSVAVLGVTHEGQLKDVAAFVREGHNAQYHIALHASGFNQLSTLPTK